jgi:hypothetical protein
MRAVSYAKTTACTRSRKPSFVRICRTWVYRQGTEHGPAFSVPYLRYDNVAVTVRPLVALESPFPSQVQPPVIDQEQWMVAGGLLLYHLSFRYMNYAVPLTRRSQAAASSSEVRRVKRLTTTKTTRLVRIP